MNSITEIIVAPSGADQEKKLAADFVCGGKNDEVTIERAINACVERNKNLLILNGIYHIDAFYDRDDGGPATAVSIPNAHREITIMGQNHEYGFQRRYDNGVVLYVTADALEKTGGRAVDVIRGKWTPAGIQNGSSLRLENIAIILNDNQHPVRCVDLRRTDRVEVKNLSLVSYGGLIAEDSDMGLGTPPPVSAKGCIGLTMTDGSNYDYSNYINVQTWGFDEGIQVGGEHVVCINCGAAIGNYGYTFGNYETNCGSNHPITMINCLDERNINLPLFNFCGDHDADKELLGEQEITMISFNIERLADKTPGGKLGDVMREVRPGLWKGNIGFTAQPAWCHTNAPDFKLWENDGSGRGIVTRNNCHKAVCTTAERLSYYPTYGQRLFDSDLGKLLICIDPGNKVWVDSMGNKV